ncbi:hypothetical protein L228DRAFT_259467 [Xylona heveae TC161]|uniref:Uncharacterized protein n=1 Tax=Xylona heveae (strain CBS 132557 / TC161) TaxID=1328760 RepID=A0A161TE66_XYLHT|nr:hypothetical protein L228DRAFT_259467 [Xylona heveae TC161]KZF24217.1 hypothetical protein L228DRAFT_259467 [Xylona heveae TC161]
MFASSPVLAAPQCQVLYKVLYYARSELYYRSTTAQPAFSAGVLRALRTLYSVGGALYARDVHGIQPASRSHRTLYSILKLHLTLGAHDVANQVQRQISKGRKKVDSRIRRKERRERERIQNGDQINGQADRQTYRPVTTQSNRQTGRPTEQ